MEKATPMMKQGLESVNCTVRLRTDGENEGEETIIVDEEKNSKSVEPEKVKPNDDDVADETKAGGTRKQSLALTRSNSKGSVSSRYLKPSCGSCHDFCKFGHKNPLDEKATQTHAGGAFGAQSPKGSGVRRLSLSLPVTIGESDSKLLFKESKSVRSPLGMSRNFLDASSPKVREIKSSDREGTSAAQATEFASLKPQLKRSKTTSPGVYKEFSSSREEKVIQAHVNRSINECGDATGRVSGGEDRKGSWVRRLSLYVTNGEKESKSHFKESKVVKSPLGMSRNSLDTSTPRAREINSTNREGRSAAPASQFIPSKPQLKRSKTTTPRVYKELSSPTRAKNKRNLQQAGELENGEGASFYASEKAQESSRNGAQLSHLSKIEIGAREDTPQFQVVKILKPENASYKQNEPVSRDSKPKSTTSEENSFVESNEKGSVWKLKFGGGTIVSLPNMNGCPRKLHPKTDKSLTENVDVEDVAETDPKNNEVRGGGLEQSNCGSEEGVHKQQKEPKKIETVDLHNVKEGNVSRLMKIGRTKVKAMVRLFETLMLVGE